MKNRFYLVLVCICILLVISGCETAGGGKNIGTEQVGLERFYNQELDDILNALSIEDSEIELRQSYQAEEGYFTYIAIDTTVELYGRTVDQFTISAYDDLIKVINYGYVFEEYEDFLNTTNAIITTLSDTYEKIDSIYIESSALSFLNIYENPGKYQPDSEAGVNTMVSSTDIWSIYDEVRLHVKTTISPENGCWTEIIIRASDDWPFRTEKDLEPESFIATYFGQSATEFFQAVGATERFLDHMSYQDKEIEYTIYTTYQPFTILGYKVNQIDFLSENQLISGVRYEYYYTNDESKNAEQQYSQLIENFDRLYTPITAEIQLTPPFGQSDNLSSPPLKTQSYTTETITITVNYQTTEDITTIQVIAYK